MGRARLAECYHGLTDARLSIAPQMGCTSVPTNDIWELCSSGPVTDIYNILDFACLTECDIGPLAGVLKAHSAVVIELTLKVWEICRWLALI